MDQPYYLPLYWRRGGGRLLLRNNMKLEKLKQREQYQAMKMLRKRIENIPKKNKAKFSQDLIRLIDLAYGEEYESYNIG